MIERRLLDRHSRRPLLDENVFAWVEEIRGRRNATDLDCFEGLHGGIDLILVRRRGKAMWTIYRLFDPGFLSRSLFPSLGLFFPKGIHHLLFGHGAESMSGCLCDDKKSKHGKSGRIGRRQMESRYQSSRESVKRRFT